MKKLASDRAAAADSPIQDRILRAAFSAFIENGYAETSTLEIATRAKVSKRDLYANFRDKHAMLVACFSRRSVRMGLAVDLPTPNDRATLEAILVKFGGNLVREVSHPTVMAAFRLAIAEAERAPEVAQALDKSARQATGKALADLVVRAQSAGLLGAGEPREMAAQYVALLWEGLMVNLLLGIAGAPTPAEIERRAAKAAAAFLRLHPAAAAPRA